MNLLFCFGISSFTGTPLQAQSGDSIIDQFENGGKVLNGNRVIFGYSYPTGNNQLVLNDGAIVINNPTAGWFRDDGTHAVTNLNYMAGYSSNLFRDFFSFNLNGVSFPITNARLQVQKFTSVPNTGYCVWQLYDVASSFSSINTDYSSALGNLSAGYALYTDLGSGASYGSDTIDCSFPGSMLISIVLDSSAVAAINASLGGYFIIGGKSEIYFPHLPPLVTTTSASNIGPDNGTLNGTVNPRGTQTAVSFIYGTISGVLTSEVPAIPNVLTGSTSLPVSAYLDTLSVNTTYYFQVKTVNTDLTVVYGEELAFSTTPDAIYPVAPVSPTPQKFCASATISDLVTQPPAGCVVLWYDAPAAGNLLGNSFELISGSTYYAAAFDRVANLFSLDRTAVTVIINSPLSPTITGSLSVCDGASNVRYTTEPGMDNYNWSVSNGGIITSGELTNSIELTWKDAGPQTVSVNYSDPTGCNSNPSVSYPVIVNPIPVPGLYGPTHLCMTPDIFTYTTEPGMTDYTWTISGGGIIESGTGLDQIQVSWREAGNQTLSVSYSSTDGCVPVEPTILAIRVGSIPDSAKAISGLTEVCAGTAGIRYSVDPIANAAGYTWMLTEGASVISGEGTNSILVNFSTHATSGWIGVNGENNCGSGAVSPAFYISVTPMPDNPGTISGPSEICKGGLPVLYSVSPVLNATGYVWTVPYGASLISGAGTNIISVFYPESSISGNITVNGTNDCGHSNTSAKYPVVVNETPSAPVITILGNILQSNANAGNQWYLNGTAIPGATNHVLQADLAGRYWAIITVGACLSDTSNNIDVVLTGISETGISGFRLFPVPNDGRFNVRTGDRERSDLTISVYNSLGVIIFERNANFPGPGSSCNIDLGTVPAGIYAVVLQNDKSFFIKNILVR